MTAAGSGRNTKAVCAEPGLEACLINHRNSIKNRCEKIHIQAENMKYEFLNSPYKNVYICLFLRQEMIYR